MHGEYGFYILSPDRLNVKHAVWTRPPIYKCEQQQYLPVCEEMHEVCFVSRSYA